MRDYTPAELGDSVAGLDIANITRDEEMVEALGLGLPVVAETQADFDLAELLTDWRADVLAAPVEYEVTVDDVERAIVASSVSRESAPKMRRHLRLIAGAAAIVGVALGGLTVLSEGANPNDPLWGIKKVVFKDQAVQTQATYSAQINLEQAEKLLAAGKPHEAKQLLNRARANLAPVSDEQTRSQLHAWVDRLSASAESAIKAATPVVPKKAKKAPAPKPAPQVTDNMPQYVPPAAPRWTPAPQQQQAPEPRQAPQPKPAPQRPHQGGGHTPRPPITILPN
jgi:molybdopterin-binding protein